MGNFGKLTKFANVFPSQNFALQDIQGEIFMGIPAIIAVNFIGAKDCLSWMHAMQILNFCALCMFV